MDKSFSKVLQIVEEKSKTAFSIEKKTFISLHQFKKVFLLVLHFMNFNAKVKEFIWIYISYFMYL